jgi:hypothetical protein
MDKARLEAIKARAEAATPGPWTEHEELDGMYAGRKTAVRTLNPENKYYSRIVTVGQTRNHSRNAEANVLFIAHARTDIPDLLTHIAALTAALEAAEKRAEGAERAIEHMLWYSSGRFCDYACKFARIKNGTYYGCSKDLSGKSGEICTPKWRGPTADNTKGGQADANNT